jgi:hypothetical protein
MGGWLVQWMVIGVIAFIRVLGACSALLGKDPSTSLPSAAMPSAHVAFRRSAVVLSVPQGRADKDQLRLRHMVLLS